MIIKLFFYARIGLFVLTYLGSMLFPRIANTAQGAVGLGKNFNYWLSWAQWDGGHFSQIANNGYHFFTDYAFMPLYPFLIKIISYFTGNVLFAGLLLSNICFLIFIATLFKLAKLKFGPSVAFFTIITYLLFPTSFFTAAFYSESLFLMLVCLCFYFLYKKNYLFAAIFCAFASITRLVGIFLFISILYTYFTSINFNIKKINYHFLHILISPAILIVYSLYLYTRFSSPFLFLTGERFWARSITDPVSTLGAYTWSILTSPQSLNYYFDFLTTIFFLAVLILGRRKIPSAMWIYSALVILAGISSGSLVSMPRYVLASVGCFIIIGNYFKERIRFSLVCYTLSLILQIILATLFINGYWVA